MITKLTEVYTLVYTFVMNTKFVGIKEFRQNISGYAKQAQAGDSRFVIMNRNKPMFAVTPFTDQDNLSSLVADIAAARAEAAAGRTFSHAEMMAEFAPE